MEQWEADVAVHFARTDPHPHQAIAHAHATIDAIRRGVRWGKAIDVKAARNRWDYQRRAVTQKREASETAHADQA
jgi:hypothetical protein